MSGEHHQLLYIGKANNLRQRLNSYKNAQPDRVSRKVIRLVHEIRAITWELCGSADEALLLNTDGEVVEAASSNLFWIEKGTLCTPPLEDGALPGITRALALELGPTLDLPTKEKSARPETLHQADGVFLTLSTLGIVEATSLDGKPLARSSWVARLQAAYQRTILEETS